MDTFKLLNGDCLELMRGMADASVDSIVTDPPYELGFMGKSWDASGVAFNVDVWREALRVLKPGGHLLAFSGSRTYHRMACAIEDAGFEIRDQIMWLYGSGFPKSLDVSKAIDKAAGAEREKVRVDAAHVRNPKATGGGKDGAAGATRPWIEAALERGYHEKDGDEPVTDAARQWAGWGTALKPAHEPICVARKPLVGTVAENVLAHGTGALNIDGCRVGTEGGTTRSGQAPYAASGWRTGHEIVELNAGRWPANVIHDGSDEVLALFPSQSGDTGSAARFFYCAKASRKDRNEGCTSQNNHPTVKPTDLMRYLCRLVTPPGGLVLDPFMGSGSTGKAAMLEGCRFVGIELSEEYIEIARARIAAAAAANDNAPPATEAAA